MVQIMPSLGISVPVHVPFLIYPDSHCKWHLSCFHFVISHGIVFILSLIIWLNSQMSLMLNL